MRKYLINYYIEEFRTTLFRQTMFAEFELMAHEEIEKGGVLTAAWLNENYDKLNSLYFGPAMSHDEYIQYEWASDPAFLQRLLCISVCYRIFGSHCHFIKDIGGRAKSQR